MGFEDILLGYEKSTKIHCTYDLPSKVKRNHLTVDIENRCLDVFVHTVQMSIFN